MSLNGMGIMRSVTVILLLCQIGSIVGQSIYREQRSLMGVATLGPSSTLPFFGGFSGVSSAPLYPNATVGLADSCPDSIFQFQLNIVPPILPYKYQDSYDRNGSNLIPGTLPVIVMENEIYRLKIYPTLGGKIASLWHKLTNKELLFDNPVFQPAALGRLGAWTSGGIEWNWPRLGHSVLTSSPVHIAEVETDKGTMLRIFEFDREMNSTFQVDLLLPSSKMSSLELQRHLYIHVTVRNSNSYNIDGYWWTNIGVQTSNSSRVIYSNSDYAVTNGGPNGLYQVKFPSYSDNPLSGADVVGDSQNTDFATDHSWPHRYYSARETFVLSKNSPSDREWMVAIDTATGQGVGHVQTSNLAGRKYWVWGTSPADVNRMQFLSIPANSSYIEMQAGVAPTQSQTFPLPAFSSLEWTEAVFPLQVSVEDVCIVGEDGYNHGARATEDIINSTLSTESFLSVHQWMSEQSNAPTSRIIYKGSGFGALHEAITKTRLAPKDVLPFSIDSDDNEALCWWELLQTGKFSKKTLDRSILAPSSYMVDWIWINRLRESLSIEDSYLVHVFLAVALRQQGDINSSNNEILSALNLNPNAALPLWMNGQYGEAWNSCRSQLKKCRETTSSEADDECVHHVTVSRDIAVSLSNHLIISKSWDNLKLLLKQIKKELVTPGVRLVSLLWSEPIRIANINLELYSYGNAQEVLRDLRLCNFAISNMQLLTLWYDAHYLLAGATSIIEKVRVRRNNIPPVCINFNGAV